MDEPAFIIKFGDDKKLVVVLGKKDKVYTVQLETSNASVGDKFDLIAIQSSTKHSKMSHFDDVTIDPNSKATIETQADNISPLELDFDGDNIPDESINPIVETTTPSCEDDSEPDRDIDGTDLVQKITSGGLNLEQFSQDFGRANCPDI